ncbi:aminoacyl-tRNA deacylase [Acinetobacter sp. ANC 4470]|uniref:Cys-tRNA(Pro) deacylase n=1 Tax=Acinetobacter sp. ANC 4470 TaxID=1977881 RepID=UPI000A3398BD|nr:Cys-tRNA(Pro) deacylase [Acinetobacter sp. ANC 4470]OTG63554.1 aminoacyl-tRNA deacylase [Acinetobacter sp. ANC 4470]
MTPACKVLKSNKIEFSIHEYEHDTNAKSFGLEAAKKLNLEVHEVFKTLLVTDSKNYYVAVLPVAHQLSLKKIAVAVGAKKLQMADPKDAERLTGYLVGGISPVGQKKRLKTVVDRSAEVLNKIYVSGGKRGLDIGVKPQDLVQVLGAQFADVLDQD